MLQELFTITELLDSRAEQATAHDAYQRKLQIIQNNIYGVDLDEFAVNIAMLRLWLSLAVEFEDDTPPPLPNLDYKIEAGDSLTAPDPSGGHQLDMFRQQQIKEFDKLKALFSDPIQRAFHPDLDEQINQLRREIAEYAHPGQTIAGFDWRVEFAEVFVNNGFDIVIANPPYGIKVDNSVRNQYFNQRSENERGQSKDSYGIFIARGIQLLKPNGILSYIVSDTWRTIKSHRPLRKRLLDNTTVSHVLDLPQWIFDATVNTGIITLQKQQAPEECKLIAADLRGIENGNWKELSNNLIAIAGHGPDIQTLTCARYTYKQNLISSFSNLPFFIASPDLFKLMDDSTCEIVHQGDLPIRTININDKTIELVSFGDEYIRIENRKVWRNIGVAQVISGIKTGSNQKYLKKIGAVGKKLPFITDHDHIATNEEIQSLTNGEKINGKNSNSFLIPFEMGIGSDLEEGLLPNYHQLPSNYYINWTVDSVESMRNEAHSDLANAEYRFLNLDRQISFSATGFYAPTFRESVAPIFVNKSSRIILPNSNRNSLLGFLCSIYARYLLKCFINHGVDVEVDDLKALPTLLDYTALESHVEELIENQIANENHSYLNKQKEIELILADMFGFSIENLREIELWFCRRYARLAEAQGVMDEVKEKYADHLARCERILLMPPSYWRSNPILELIAHGENHTLEFKETLQYNIYTNQADANTTAQHSYISRGTHDFN